MEYYARKDEKLKKQLLTDHIDGVRIRCQKSNMDNFKAILELSAIAHDMGKFSLEWQRYMLEDLPTKVPHSTFGMALIAELIEEQTIQKYPDDIKIMLQDIVSYAVGAHHGLFDALTLCLCVIKKQ
jgi:CRISPR-associated endonuclease Cas3-HD